jgi:hypothetical protein
MGTSPASVLTLVFVTKTNTTSTDPPLPEGFLIEVVNKYDASNSISVNFKMTKMWLGSSLFTRRELTMTFAIRKKP